MKKKVVSILLATAMVATLAGCGGSDPAPAAEAPAAEEAAPAAEEAPAADEEAPAAEETAPAASGDLAYSGNISIMHFSTSEESEGNGGSDGFRTCLAQWQSRFCP